MLKIKTIFFLITFIELSNDWAFIFKISKVYNYWDDFGK